MGSTPASAVTTRESSPLLDPSTVLAALFEDDRREHASVPAVGTPQYVALRERDGARRARAEDALAALASSGAPSAEDLYHAASLFQHGETAADAYRAHTLAGDSAARGHAPARWLYAAAYDRWCMYEGRPQRYGTQIVPDGVRYRVWDVDPATTDAERAEHDVPPLAEQERRAAELSRNAPQPPMHGAPEWLRGALERWHGDGGASGRRR